MKKFRKFIIAIIVIAVFTVLSLFAFTYYSRAESPIIFISQLLPMTREGLTATERVIETRNLPNPTFLSEPDLLTDATLEINLPALFSAPVVFLEDITAPNILYSLDAGDGIELSGDPQSPTITNTGVISLEGVNGAIELQSDNIRISTSGNTITLSADIPAPDIQKLTESDIEAFIFDADNTGTLSSGTLSLDELSYTGTIPSAIVVGEYSDITGVGTITSGTWQGSVISSTYLDPAVILSTEIDTYTELNTIVADVTLTHNGLIDTSAEIAGIVGDETGSGALVFANSPTFAGNVLFPGSGIWESTGDVGIGTTNPSAKLEVAGQVKITGGSPGANKVLTSDASGLATWQTLGAASIGDDSLDFDKFSDNMTLDAKTIINQAGFDFGFQGTGNVGIGTSTPSEKLHVIGNAIISGNITSGGIITGTGSGLTGLNASNLASGTVPSARISGNYSGITGVGTITSGTWQGSVISSTYLDPAVILSTEIDTYTELNTIVADVTLTHNGLIDTSAEIAGIVGDETGSGALVFANSPTFAGNVLFPGSGIWESTGDVGIGTTSPGYKLHLSGTATTTMVENTSASSYSYYSMQNDTGFNAGLLFAGSTYAGYGGANSLSILNGHSDGNISIFAGGTTAANERVRITSSGNLGIGTSSPSRRLHVDAAADGWSARIQNDNGYIDFGPNNTEGAHIYTDRPQFYFNQKLNIITNDITSYNGDFTLQRAGTTRLTLGSSTSTFATPLNVNTGTYTISLEGRNTWDTGGATQYPVIRSSSSNERVMFHNIHVPYMQNGQGGYTGTTTGAIIRFASNYTSPTSWDVGIDSDLGTDTFGISRGTSNFLSIANNGTVTIPGTLMINGAEAASLKTHNATVTDGWYRIASDGPTSDGGTGGHTAYGRFVVWSYESDRHCQAEFTAGYDYSRSATSPTVILNSNNCYNGTDTPITAIRAVAGDAYEGAAVEVYIDVTTSASVGYQIYDEANASPATNGNGAWTPVDWTAGSVWTGAGATTVNIASTDAVIGMASGSSATDEFYINRNGVGIFSNGIYNQTADGELGASANFVFRDTGDSWLRLRTASGGSTYADLAVGDLNVAGNITALQTLSFASGNTLTSQPTGDYGSIQVNGGGKGAWEGYSIDGRAVFMHNGTTETGIYNDVENEWLFHGTHNAGSIMYYNGAARVTTTSGGATITGDGNATGDLTAGVGLGVANTTSTTGYGLSLYGGATAGAPTYGMMFAGTATFGGHGGVSGSDWATYLTMSNTTTRGWIFRRGSTNVASIAGNGTLYTNGIINAGSNITAGGHLYVGGGTSYYFSSAGLVNAAHLRSTTYLQVGSTAEQGLYYDINSNDLDVGGLLAQDGTVTVKDRNGVARLEIDTDTSYARLKLQMQTSNNIGVCHVVNGSFREIVDCSSAPTDLAENFSTVDASIEAGDLVIGDGQSKVIPEPNTPGKITTKASIKKTDMRYDDNILGIISTDPNQLYGDDGVFDPSENPVPVSLAGRVPTKVSLENGPIRTGDYITSSSTPGVGMKATRAGRVVGIALQDFTGGSGNNQFGKIVVFVNPTWYDPSTKLNSAGELSINADNGLYSVKNSTDNTTFDNSNAAKEMIAAYLKTGKITTTDLSVAGKAEFTNLQVNNFKVGGKTLNQYIEDSVVTGQVFTSLDDQLTAQETQIAQLDLESNILSTSVASQSASLSTVTARLDQIEQATNDTEAVITSLQDRIAALETMFANNMSTNSAMLFTESPSATVSASIARSITDTEVIFDKKLIAEDDVTILGKLNTSDIGVTGTISSGLLTINGFNDEMATPSATISTLGGVLSLQHDGMNGIEFIAGKVAIDVNGNVLVREGDVEIENGDLVLRKGSIKGSTSIRGIDVPVTAGATEITVTFTDVNDTDTYAISVLPTWFTNIIVQDKTIDGFKILFDRPAPVDATLDWLIVE
ncbi:hypothetical protein IPM65_03660 [Candidatus Roizmanbacteria bacterium]|nr:MAG: hypothetical protein IPM65_03660 [Candidatus Roizmanbacteria bacterium]